ncbi:MAG: hypothetical protein JO025_20615 [Verrucomicrobia bacterium]|nr:hypothetical protein [Verrucomicrobiota bacterium]
MKIPLLLLGVSLTLSVISQAGPVRAGGFGGRSFHTGVVARGINSAGFRGGGFNRGFRGRFIARRNRPIFFQQFGWPTYWYPYADPLSYSYLEPDSQPDYQYWDNSSAYSQQSPAYVQQESTNRAVPQNPVVIVINASNSRPADPAVPTDPRGNVGYANYSYVPSGVSGPQRVVSQDPNQHNTPDPITPGEPVMPQATPVPPQNTKTSVQTGTGPFSKFVVVSYLQDRGKDVVSVKNVETNDVQRITSQPNIDHFRIVEIHPNADQRQFEAIISNGSEQGPVRFQF